MTADPGWSAMKSDWQDAGAPDPGLSSRLRTSLLWRIWAARAWFASEAVSFVLLLLIIVQNFAVGEDLRAWFLAAIASLCVAGFVWARRGRRLGNRGESLVDLIEISLSRARTGLRIVYVSYVVIALMFVATFAEAEWPLHGDERSVARLAWLGLSAAAAVAWQLVTMSRRDRFAALQKVYCAAASAASR
jgi:hypothetical protein